jgi:hypothetical protein
MGLRGKYWIAAAAVAGLGVILALLGSTRAGPVLGQAATVRVVPPGSAPLGEDFQVGVNVEGVANLAAYEWTLTYDPALLTFVSVANASFLGSSGRTVNCPPEILEEGKVRFGCGTLGATPPGPTGSGTLSTLTFSPVAAGSASLCFTFISLADPLAEDIPATVVHGSVAIGGGAARPPDCGPLPTPTPFSGMTPGPSPEAPTQTPGPPPVTSTPSPPTPTPAPTPPPGSAEVVDLILGCNPLASTYPDGTTVQTLAAAVAPPETLLAMWKFGASAWLGYSPEFPEASDLAATGFLDVVFLCVNDPGTFVRPLV